MSLIKKYKFLSKSYNIRHFKIIEDVPVKGAMSVYLQIHLNTKLRKWLKEFFLYFSVYFFSKITSLLPNLFQFNLNLLILTCAAFATVLLQSFLLTLLDVTYTCKINLGPFNA